MISGSSPVYAYSACPPVSSSNGSAKPESSKGLTKELFATIARMATHLRTLLEAIVANPEERISRLSLLPAWERKRVVVDWNGTRTSFGRLSSFSERFARHAQRRPEAIAVSAGSVRLNYRELARRASAIADRLASEGTGPEVVVILLAERDVDFLAAMIAVQQAGGAFLPLDPTLPAARLAQIIRHSRTPLVLAGQACAATLEKALSGIRAPGGPQVLSLSELTQAVARDPGCPVRPAPSNLASYSGRALRAFMFGRRIHENVSGAQARLRLR